ncbi:unnamed protein product [Linum tenue]|uniref:RING-type domain-containing protein n=1 Tax=Linum tenue TaxID=586396 RepID=A0AAV0NML0_9ROSI|nr:unnamed protein product [Linum tenue]
MGLSTLPSPSEGVLCLLLVNTALSISIVKGILRSILHIVGIHLPPSSPPYSEFTEEPTMHPFEFTTTTSEGYIEEFRSRSPPTRFDKVCRTEHDCSVCLTRFNPESEINRLSCGHIFHMVCLEKWLDYWNITCPLCRTPLMPEKDVAPCFS